MTANADDAPPAEGSGEDWDENLLVWNATVARVSPPAIPPGSGDDAAGVAGRKATGREQLGPNAAGGHGRARARPR
jgi:hypothetical protein